MAYHDSSTQPRVIQLTSGQSGQEPGEELLVMDAPSRPQAQISTCEKVAHLMKSGNINQGYAQCNVDLLARLVAAGRCSSERIQCRQMATLRVTAFGAAEIATFRITPVGPSFAREIVLGFSLPDVAADFDYVPIVTQVSSKGRVAVTGATASDFPTGNVPVGFPLQAFGNNFQNYVLPSGIIFDSANDLVVVMTNAGTDDGSSVVGVTYDQIREG